jgi:DNA-binding HxlR family transcriptional regulator
MDQNEWHRTAFCPRFQRAVELIGGRWSGAIIRALLGGVTRFSDLSATIPGISDRMLSERLKELEAEGLVERTVYPDIPVRIEYHPTEKCRSLGTVMESISYWADSWIQLEQTAAK